MTQQEHIDSLAAELGCKVVQKTGMAGMMYVEYEPPLVEGPVIQEQKDYLIMLHELGHVFHGHTQGRPPYQDKTYYFDHGVLRSEAEAWNWAIEKSIGLLEQATRRYMWDKCLGTYYDGYLFARGKRTRLHNGNRHHISFVYDTPDAYFWCVKDSILGGD